MIASILPKAGTSERQDPSRLRAQSELVATGGHIVVGSVACICDGEDLVLLKDKHVPAIGDPLVAAVLSSSQDTVCVQEILHTGPLNHSLEAVHVIGQIRAIGPDDPVQASDYTSELGLFFFGGR